MSPTTLALGYSSTAEWPPFAAWTNSMPADRILAIAPNPTTFSTSPAEMPLFDLPLSGWYWQVTRLDRTPPEVRKPLIVDSSPAPQPSDVKPEAKPESIPKAAPKPDSGSKPETPTDAKPKPTTDTEPKSNAALKEKA